MKNILLIQPLILKYIKSVPSKFLSIPSINHRQKHKQPELFFLDQINKYSRTSYDLSSAHKLKDSAILCKFLSWTAWKLAASFQFPYKLGSYLKKVCQYDS
ncbi:hypothetical protein BpHYR1_030610 [Brachionus plicatilis]|uniref:Uncharacterized protein n=1 Tax=Brachionus plicatilis TaxID=10195 RepID=A0A3M7Q4P9_BRAPC|nr:hypothetical protein BpHYR1_030610 [Brachionus plicatilis]